MQQESIDLIPRQIKLCQKLSDCFCYCGERKVEYFRTVHFDFTTLRRKSTAAAVNLQMLPASAICSNQGRANFGQHIFGLGSQQGCTSSVTEDGYGDLISTATLFRQCVTSEKKDFAGGPETFLIYNILAAPPVAAIPEPGTYAMLMAGLGSIGFIARRRRPRQTAG